MKLPKICILLGMLLLLYGCWNYREADSLFLVTGCGLDYDFEKDRYRMTVEIAAPEGSGKNVEIKPKILSADGDTVFDAVRNIIRISSKRLYWGHAQAYIIGRNLAEKSILPLLDWIIRDAEPRETVVLYISKCETAEEIFKEKIPSSRMLAYGIYEMTTSAVSVPKAPYVQVYQLYGMLTSDTGVAYVPAVDITREGGSFTPIVTGAALLDKERLAGFLSEEDTRSLLFLRDEIKGGILPVKTGSGPMSGYLSLEIFKSSTIVTPVFQEDRMSFKVKTALEVAVGGEYEQEKYLSADQTAELENICSQFLKNKLEDFISRLKQDYGLDAVGFGEVLKRRKPGLWKEVKSNWNEETFRDIDVQMDVKVTLRNTGQYLKGL